MAMLSLWDTPARVSVIEHEIDDGYGDDAIADYFGIVTSVT